MEEDPPAKGKGRALKSIGLLVLFLVVATAINFALKPPPNEPRAVFLHPDGQISLGSRDGEKFDPGDIARWPRPDTGSSYLHFVFDAPPGTLLSAWSPTIEPLASLGYSHYQLRVGRDSMNFQIPGSGVGFDHYSPTVVDIRRTPTAPSLRKDNPDVVVLIDQSATCDQVLAATRPYRKPGISLTVGDETASVSSGILFLIRTENEDACNEAPKMSLAAKVRNLFRP